LTLTDLKVLIQYDMSAWVLRIIFSVSLLFLAANVFAEQGDLITHRRLNRLRTALSRFFRDYQRYPRKQNISEVISLLERLDYLPLYSGLAVDGRQRPFVYRCNRLTYQLYSVGPNGRDNNGKQDDISVRSPVATVKPTFPSLAVVICATGGGGALLLLVLAIVRRKLINTR
jgi:hypothetical protein